jgi:hypothetical protein
LGSSTDAAPTRLRQRRSSGGSDRGLGFDRFCGSLVLIGEPAVAEMLIDSVDAIER